MTTQLPGYWTLQEIAEELGKSQRWVLHQVKGRHGRPPSLKSHRVQRIYFVPDFDAKEFIKRHRNES